jgi:AraC-like DNA-binding protein
VHGLSLVLLRPLAQVIARIGGDSAQFLKDLGVDASSPEDAQVDAALADRVLAELGAARGDPAFGLTLARTAVTYPLGFFDHLVWPGATVRDALERSSRFYALLTSRSTLVLEERDGSATIVQRIATGAPRGTVLTEFAFASFVLRARRAAGTLKVRALRFMHTADLAIYTDLFDAPVTFGEREDALDLDSIELARVLGTADATTARVLEEQAVRMTKAPSFLDGVRDAIRRGLREPNNDLPALAETLGISERTLQRRLSEHGTSLRDLIDDVRKEEAIRLLRSGASAAEIALEIGFARPQAFHKAFVRWTGVTPGAFKKLP